MITALPFFALTNDQKRRVWEMWHDATEPTDYAYELQGGQVISRIDVRRAFNHQATAADYGLPPELPKPVASALHATKRITHRDVIHEVPAAMQTRRKPMTLQQIERELSPFPGARRKRSRGLGAWLIHVTAVAIYQIQQRRFA